MRALGWTVTVVVGGYTAYLLLKSIPDLVRYAKLSSM
jgi:hypothetical protein